MKKLLVILIIIIIFNKIFFNIEKFSTPNNCKSEISKQQFDQSVANLKRFIDVKKVYNPTWFGTYSNRNFNQIVDNDCEFYYNIKNIENASVSSSVVRELKNKFNNLVFCTGASNVGFWPCNYYGNKQKKNQNNIDFDNIIKFKENIENNLIGLCKIDEIDKLKDVLKSMSGKYGDMFRYINTNREKLCEKNLIKNQLLTSLKLEPCTAKSSYEAKPETAALSQRKMLCRCNWNCPNDISGYSNCSSPGICKDHTKNGCPPSPDS